MGVCQPTCNLQRSQGSIISRHQQDILKSSRTRKQSNQIHYTPIRNPSYQEIRRKSKNFDSTCIKEESHMDYFITGFLDTNFTSLISQSEQQEQEKKFCFSYRIITLDQMYQDSNMYCSGTEPRSSQQSLKDIYYKCQYCQLWIEKQIIQLPCCHSYHVDCLMELLVKQLNNHSYSLICLCNKQINIKILMLFQIGNIMKESLLKNQLNQLFLNELKKNAGIKYCKKCKFIYIEKNISTECKCVNKK